MFIETKLRSGLKAVSWRLVGTLATVVIVFGFTGRIFLAFSVGFWEMASKTLLYFLHERIWDKIQIGRQSVRPAVVWFTGLSGSGKSTVARLVYAELQKLGLKAEYLDGDRVRQLFPNTGFSKEERDNHVRRIGHLAGTLEKNGVFVVASFISPYARSRAAARGLCSNFIEIYVSTPLEECEKRDVKGLYAKARRGEIKNFTGIDDPYEPPTRHEVEINTARLSPQEALRRVMEHINPPAIHGLTRRSGK